MRKNGDVTYARGGALSASGYKPEQKFIGLKTLVNGLPPSRRESLLEGYDMKVLTPVFEDADLMRTADAFLYGGLNVSATARGMFMHRNTLNYRLNVIKKKTGMDLRNFETAITFKILQLLYSAK